MDFRMNFSFRSSDKAWQIGNRLGAESRHPNQQNPAPTMAFPFQPKAWLLPVRLSLSEVIWLGVGDVSSAMGWNHFSNTQSSCEYLARSKHLVLWKELLIIR
jgi:hypothetical protein